MSASSQVITIFLIIINIISIINAQVTAQKCRAEYECAKQNIIADKIDCIGTSSCEGASLTSNNRKIGYIECSGDQSCNSRYINKTEYPSILSATSDVYCSGYNACRMVGAINAKNVYCTGYTGCESQHPNYDARTQIIADNNIYCYASTGCHYSHLEPGKKMLCSGGYGCVGAIIRGGIATHCEGMSACTSAQIFSQRRFVSCDGSVSCQSAVITNVDEVRVYGNNAGTGLTINGAKTVKAYGENALLQATIDSNSTTTVEAYGVRAGQEANFICRDGGVCTLLCKSSGCKSLTYRCLPGATCNVSPDGCLSDNSVALINGVHCPTFTFTDSKIYENENNPINWSDIIPNTLIPVDTWDTLCSASRECVNATMFDGNLIICAGEGSCQGATVGTSIYCTGSLSCVEAVINNRDGYHVSTCYGYQSCLRADIKSTMNREGGFACHGVYGCGEATVWSRYIYCYGKYSCARSNEINATNTIDIHGYFGGARSTLYSDQVRVWAYKGLYLGIVDSIGRGRLKVKLFAHLGGDSGTVICRSESNCTLECATTGCRNLDYICESGAICNIEPTQCDGSRNSFKGIDCPTRTSSVFADDYMVKKYEMNRDVYDAFDSFIDNFVVNSNDEDMDGYDAQEKLFANSDIGLMEKHIKEYNMNVFVVVVSAVIIGLLCLWCRARDVKNEYESI